MDYFKEIWHYEKTFMATLVDYGRKPLPEIMPRGDATSETGLGGYMRGKVGYYGP